MLGRDKVFWKFYCLLLDEILFQQPDISSPPLCWVVTKLTSG